MAYSTATLAEGCFGKVYKEKYKDKWAAVKRVPQHLISRADLERECEVYNKAGHPNIVKLLGNITLKNSKWEIPLEFIFGEDLETTIFKTSKSKVQLSPANKGTIIIGMCEGLLHLHLRDIVHQDLKPDNIMIEHNTNRAVIIDLGLAKFFRNGLNSAIDMGNEAYSAPEVLRLGSQRNQRSDVWAMGKIIAELCARVRLPTTSVCPTKIKEVLKDQPFCASVCRMVETDPSLRASMAGVIGDIRWAGGGSASGIVLPTRLSPRVSPSRTNNRSPSPVNRSPARSLSPPQRNRSPARFQSPPERSRSPARFQSPLAGLPNPETTLLHPFHRSPSPQPTEEENKNLVPVNVTQNLERLGLTEADLPCMLPTTGVVRVCRYEEKNGEIQRWEQKEVVTSDGKIVKYDDIMIDNK